MKTSNGWITSRIAICHDCGMRWEDELNNNSPKRHAEKHNHTVSVQVVRMYYYRGTKRKGTDEDQHTF